MRIKIFIVSLALVSMAMIETKNTFSISSNDLGGEATTSNEFNGFGCAGENQSPQLSWENPPEGTQSFAITMYDPNAPTGSGWWHWLVFDIPANVNELVANAGNVKTNLAPSECIQSITDYGSLGYGGPCPPEGHGVHKYEITVHALKVKSLGLDANTNAAVVGYNLWANSLGKATLTTYYEREKNN